MELESTIWKSSFCFNKNKNLANRLRYIITLCTIRVTRLSWSTLGLYMWTLINHFSIISNLMSIILHFVLSSTCRRAFSHLANLKSYFIFLVPVCSIRHRITRINQHWLISTNRQHPSYTSRNNPHTLNKTNVANAHKCH